MKRRAMIALLTALLIVSLTGCKKKDRQPSPSPAPTSASTVAPTQAPTSVQTPAPTPAPTPIPTPVPTPKPTPVPTPKATPVPTPVPTPKATPVPTPKPRTTPASDTTSAPTSSSSPTPTPTPSQAPAALGPTITKQPATEGHFVGESAVFITSARDWNSLYWTAVSPSGREIDLQTFRNTFPDSTVMGDEETTLTITNLNIDMSGWSFYCTFKNDEGDAVTDSARLKVTAQNADSTDSSSGSSSSGSSSSSRKTLRCPFCGTEIKRDMITCPSCGRNVLSENEDAYVQYAEDGSIIYLDNTGAMYYNSGDQTTSYVDTNGTYAQYDYNGNVLSYQTRRQREEEERNNMTLEEQIAAALAEDYGMDIRH